MNVVRGWLRPEELPATVAPLRGPHEIACIEGSPGKLADRRAPALNRTEKITQRIKAGRPQRPGRDMHEGAPNSLLVLSSRRQLEAKTAHGTLMEAKPREPVYRGRVAGLNLSDNTGHVILKVAAKRVAA